MAESVEKLEDGIVRSAEQVSSQVRAAKDAIASVIFGQDRVIENTLVTILSGGHALLIGVPGLAKTKLVETLGVTLGLDAKRIQFTPDLMPSDILGAEVLDESTAGRRAFRFIAGPVFAQLLMADEINRASPRTQSALLQAMQEQHITVAGARHDLPKPFHVLATQNPLEQEGTYPLPEAQLDRFLMEIDVDYPDRDAERRILFETTGAEETLAKGAMTPDALITAQRLIRRLPVGDSVVEAIPLAGALGPPGSGRRRSRQVHCLGPRPARQPIPDAGGARACADRRPPGPLDRRRARPCRARAEAPHGVDVPGARRRPHDSGRDPAIEDTDRLMAAENGRAAKEILAIRRADGESRTLAASLPRLVLEARRIAANVIHGLHGRRRAGSGENFWQYRRFVSGEPSQNVDWRRSARDDHLYVRELEWEASHTVWIWPDRSPSMAFASKNARESKLERTLIVAFALAELLVAGGERVGIPGLMAPTASRSIIDRMAQAMLHDDADRLSLPPSFVPAALAEIIVLSDFWSPIAEIRTTLAGLSSSGAHGTMVQVVDPAEESFPYSGRVEFVEPEGFGVITAGRAESWAQDYTARLALHRDQIRAETNKLDWLFTTHATDRSAAELLLFLHAGMQVSKSGARTTTIKAGPAA
ncbi:MoxR-like ATPase [Bradyrhizobium sp. USDA 336]